MMINLKYTGVSASESVVGYVQRKFESLSKLVKNESIRAEVELGKITSHHHKGELYKAEANIHHKTGLVRAEATSGTLYAAIDLLKDELHNKLIALKGRSESRLRRGARAIKSLLKRSN